MASFPFVRLDDQLRINAFQITDICGGYSEPQTPIIVRFASGQELSCAGEAATRLLHFFDDNADLLDAPAPAAVAGDTPLPEGSLTERDFGDLVDRSAP